MAEQLFFDFGDSSKEFSITNPIRLITLFSGYDSQAMALRNLGVNFEIYKTSEWQVVSTASAYQIFHADDKTDYSKDLSDDEVFDALVTMGISFDDKSPVYYKDVKRKGIKTCREIYNQYKACHNLGSITNFHGKDLEIVDVDKYCYMLFYSFCCQDLSVAGKGAGCAKGSGTRSGLLWEVERLLTECKEFNGNLPKVLFLENVPQLHSKKNMADFQKWLDFLSSIGYKSMWMDLNAKDYGIPQNRNRVFCISILGDYEYHFPKTIPLRYCMTDVLEEEVDEKFFIKNEKADILINQLIVENKIPEIENEN